MGLGLGGWFIGDGFVQSRTADRFVTVKGISERDVQADIALWPIRFVATDDDLNRAQAMVKRSEKTVLGFLQRFGLEPLEDGQALPAVEVHRGVRADQARTPRLRAGRHGPV